jgi:hypothetical protein
MVRMLTDIRLHRVGPGTRPPQYHCKSCNTRRYSHAASRPVNRPLPGRIGPPPARAGSKSLPAQFDAYDKSSPACGLQYPLRQDALGPTGSVPDEVLEAFSIGNSSPASLADDSGCSRLTQHEFRSRSARTLGNCSASDGSLGGNASFLFHWQSCPILGPIRALALGLPACCLPDPLRFPGFLRLGKTGACPNLGSGST